MNLNSLIDLVKCDGFRYLGEECAEKTASLLSAPDVRMVDGAPTRELVNQLLPTLKARLKNTIHTEKSIFGIENLIEKLESMDDVNRVIGYGFISSGAAGNIYLSDSNGSLLGVTIVDKY